MYFKAILEAFLTSQGYVDLSPVWGLFYSLLDVQIQFK